MKLEDFENNYNLQIRKFYPKWNKGQKKILNGTENGFLILYAKFIKLS